MKMKGKAILMEDRNIKRGKKVTNKLVMISKTDNLVPMKIWVKMSSLRKTMARKILKWIIRMKNKNKKRKWMRTKRNLNKFSMKSVIMKMISQERKNHSKEVSRRKVVRYQRRREQTRKVAEEDDTYLNYLCSNHASASLFYS